MCEICAEGSRFSLCRRTALKSSSSWIHKQSPINLLVQISFTELPNERICIMSTANFMFHFEKWWMLFRTMANGCNSDASFQLFGYFSLEPRSSAFFLDKSKSLMRSCRTFWLNGIGSLDLLFVLKDITINMAAAETRIRERLARVQQVKLVQIIRHFEVLAGSLMG